MRFAPVAVLALLVLFAGSACSRGNASKISNDNVTTLNQVGKNLDSLLSQTAMNLKKCSSTRNRAKCVNKLLSSTVDQMESGAYSVDQVADDASGECQTDLRAVARDIRDMAKEVRTGAATKAGQRFTEDWDLLYGGCNLKRMN
ncbi:MAG: hypothetical protein ABSC51_08435 [Gaiellaceae bacterium]|jgi:hypothetical protein